MTGIFGNPFLQTNSPLSPSFAGFPWSSKTSISIPSSLTAHSPAYDGKERVPWKKEPHSSVPPENWIWQTGPNASASQAESEEVRTAPVE